MIPNEVQAALVALGYSVAVDGDIGPATKLVIQDFQRRHGLQVDGIAGRETIAALHQALACQTVPDRPGVLTPAIIKAVAPKARADIVEALVGAVAPFAAIGIVTKLRTAHFLAQIATETGGLMALDENLNYSVDGLIKTFSRKRISKAQAEVLGRKPGRAADQEAIANAVYGGAWGEENLGNTEPDDGWRYRGGGLMQTTGRANHRRAGFEANPEAIRTPLGGLKAALTFWSNNDLNRIADRDDITALRKVVNGGTNGLAEAKTYLAKAKKALNI